ncbi:MAG: hypothetical protein ACJAYK_002964 [Crocinitomicaceae bacterium]
MHLISAAAPLDHWTLTISVQITWHGELDDWSPVSMADYLEWALPNCKGKYIQAGCSHYSCLLAVAPLVCHIIAIE